MKQNNNRRLVNETRAFLRCLIENARRLHVYKRFTVNRQSHRFEDVCKTLRGDVLIAVLMKA